MWHSYRNNYFNSTISRSHIMLGWALIFFIVAVIAAALGFGGIAGAATGIAQLLFFVFLVLLVISVVMHLVRGKAPRF
jgi:uncharacterized membrane protein YtjA (UPF0391 family)